MSRANAHDEIAKNLGSNCTAEATCGAMLFVSCQPELDGPTFYVTLPQGEIISACGGACWDRADNSDCEKKCPPPEWTCKP